MTKFLVALLVSAFTTVTSQCYAQVGLQAPKQQEQKCDNVYYDHLLWHQKMYPPCPSQVLLDYEDIQLQHHQYIDFADFTNSTERVHMQGVRLIGFVWVKVQGHFFMLPYYTWEEKP